MPPPQLLINLLFIINRSESGDGRVYLPKGTSFVSHLLSYPHDWPFAKMTVLLFLFIVSVGTQGITL